MLRKVVCVNYRIPFHEKQSCEVSPSHYPVIPWQLILLCLNSHFETRDELLWVLVASMCLPIAFILDFPVNCGSNLGLCFDGGFSNDSPCLDSYTITVSALHRYFFYIIHDILKCITLLFVLFKGCWYQACHGLDELQWWGSYARGGAQPWRCFRKWPKHAHPSNRCDAHSKVWSRLASRCHWRGESRFIYLVGFPAVL